MHSPVVRLEVVPSATRERYEKSLIGQLFGNGTGPDASPRVTTAKDPPPPVKAKPAFRPSESPAMRVAEEAAAMETAESVRRFSPSSNRIPIFIHSKNLHPNNDLVFPLSRFSGYGSLFIPVVNDAEDIALTLFLPPKSSTALLFYIKFPKDRSESPLLRKNPALSGLVSTKKGGRRLRIDLKKGEEIKMNRCILLSFYVI